MSKRTTEKIKPAYWQDINKICIKLFALVLVSLSVCKVKAQFHSDVRLTNDPASSYTSFNNAWCVAASGNSVHVVWHDFRDGNNEIYYKLSTDAGVNWGSDTRLTNNNSSSMNPAISVSGQMVHVVWQDSRDMNNEMYYKRSTNGGSSWSADTRLTNNIASSIDPSITMSGSAIHIVWWDNRQGNYEIYHIGSSDAGSSWGIDTNITGNSAFACRPSISASGNLVHVVWYDNPMGNFEIYYKRSTDGGIGWGLVTQLTNNNAFSCGPTISVSGLLVHVLWYDTRDGNNEIYYKRSSNNGTTWGEDTRLTNNAAASKFPSVLASGLAVHSVWVDDRDGDNEVYYKRSTDGGLNWETDIRLTNNPSNSQYPSVAVSGLSTLSGVHVVWNDDRDGNVEIYYKNDPTGNPVGIININSDIPSEFSLSQNYPNPFNPSTNIKFEIAKPQDASLIIYDQLGREVRQLSFGFMKAGTYEINFDANGLSTGVYFYKIMTGSSSITRKMFLLK